jgi:hypothetical protein
MRSKWDIGGGAPALSGAGIGAARGLGPAANENGPAPVASADGRAVVEVAADRVRLKHRSAGGFDITLAVPLPHFRGVAADVDIGPDGLLGGVRVVLVHEDPALEVALYRSASDEDLVAEWRGWSRRLGLPLIARGEGADEVLERRLGRLTVGPALARRAPRAFLKRRPKLLRRRKVGVVRPRKAALSNTRQG